MVERRLKTLFLQCNYRPAGTHTRVRIFASDGAADASSRPIQGRVGTFGQAVLRRQDVRERRLSQQQLPTLQHPRLYAHIEVRRSRASHVAPESPDRVVRWRGILYLRYARAANPGSIQHPPLTAGRGSCWFGAPNRLAAPLPRRSPSSRPPNRHAWTPSTSTASPTSCRSSTVPTSSTSPTRTRTRRRAGRCGCRTWARSTASTTSWRRGASLPAWTSGARATSRSRRCSNPPSTNPQAPTGGWRKASTWTRTTGGWRSSCATTHAGTTASR